MDLIKKLDNFLGEEKFTSVTAKNIKKGMKIHKFGKVDDVSKQGHIVIVYSGKNRKKYDEGESVTIDEAMGFVQKLDYQKKKKAVDTDLTQNVNSPKDFDKALNMFMKGAQKLIDDDYKKNYTNLKPPVLVATKGGRYVKIIRKNQDSSGGSVHAFIDAKEGPTYGDILKPASYKAPAKHARGNLFDGSWGLKYMSSYGPAYLRN